MASVKGGARLKEWLLDRELKGGANGDVWLVSNDAGTPAVLKLLKVRYLQNPTDPASARRISRFLDEIRFMADHRGRPGLLPLLDHEIPATLSPKDRPWMVTPLAIPVRESGLTDFNSVVRTVASYAETLAGLHAEGKYHRDIHPGNLFVLDGVPVLGDFGLVDFPGKAAVTVNREVFGPVNYVAPELQRDPEGSLPGPGDVYSLAKTLWVLATEQSYPLPGPLLQVERLANLSSYISNPNAARLGLLLERSTRNDPTARPDMAEVAAELAAYLKVPATPAIPDASSAIARLAPIIERGIQATNEAAEAARRFEATVEQLIECASRVADALIRQTGPLSHERGGRWGYIQDEARLLHNPPPTTSGHSAPAGFLAYIPLARSPDLVGFFGGFHLYAPPGDSAVLHAFYSAAELRSGQRSETSRRRIFWERRFVFPLQSLRGEAMVGDAIADFEGRFVNAIEGLAEFVESLK
ncbi:MAG TPA: protein kinase [Humisphaera sp.]